MKNTKFWLGRLKGSGHSEDLDVDENIVCTMKSSSTIRHEGAWMERRYSSYSFSTSALDGDEWSASRPGSALA
jgi:hypothetical protein